MQLLAAERPASGTRTSLTGRLRQTTDGGEEAGPGWRELGVPAVRRSLTW